MNPQPLHNRILRLLSRETSSGEFIPQLDGLRFVAIAMVVLFHVNGFVGAHSPIAFSPSPTEDVISRLLIHGHYGVQFFFIISGFILALPFASRHVNQTPRINLRSYYTRRLTRLEPPYLVVLTLLFCFIVLVRGQDVRVLLPRLLTGFGYVHNLVYGAGNRLNGVAWSLEIEVQFYLLVPLLTRVFSIHNRLRRRFVIVGCALAAIIFQLFFVNSAEGALAFSILNFLQFFLIGFLLADFYLCEWREKQAHRRTWDLVAIVGGALLPFVWSYVLLIRFAFPVIAFLIYCGVFRGVVAHRLLSNRWLVTIGGMCYSIYLLHYPLINLLFAFSKTVGITRNYDLNLLVQVLIVVPLLLFCCSLFFLLIEKPCMKKDWPQRLWGRARSLMRLPAQTARAEATNN